MVLVGSIGDREYVETWDIYLLKTGHLLEVAWIDK